MRDLYIDSKRIDLASYIANNGTSIGKFNCLIILNTWSFLFYIFSFVQSSITNTWIKNSWNKETTTVISQVIILDQSSVSWLLSLRILAQEKLTKWQKTLYLIWTSSVNCTFSISMMNVLGITCFICQVRNVLPAQSLGFCLRGSLLLVCSMSTLSITKSRSFQLERKVIFHTRDFW